MNLLCGHTAQLIIVFLFYLIIRLQPNTVCGMESAMNLKRSLEKSTTATTPVLPSRCSLRVLAFSRWKFWCFCPVIADMLQLNICILLLFQMIFYDFFWRRFLLIRYQSQTSFPLCLHAGALSRIQLRKPWSLLWCWPVANSQRESPASSTVFVPVCTLVITLTNEAHD